MFHSRSIRRPGFTLVEMLVVLAIIGVLAALLLPAVMSAIVAARRAAVAIELNQLTSAIESYKQDKGDYPPNFRDSDVLNRHIRKCYPKADPSYVSSFINFAMGVDTSKGNQFICESEALVFWLAMTDNDPRYPFLSYFNPNDRPINPKKYYEFNQERLKNIDGDVVASFEAKNCQETFYIYIDSRSYDSYNRATVEPSDLARFMNPDGKDLGAQAEDNKEVRPYWSTNFNNQNAGTTRAKYKPINPTTFQLICAGLDGEFGTTSDDTDVKLFPSGDNYTEDDKDNIANFSNGRPLRDSIP